MKTRLPQKQLPKGVRVQSPPRVPQPINTMKTQKRFKVYTVQYRVQEALNNTEWEWDITDFPDAYTNMELVHNAIETDLRERWESDGLGRDRPEDELCEMVRETLEGRHDYEDGKRRVFSGPYCFQYVVTAHGLIEPE